jgi:hypothetical protein
VPIAMPANRGGSLPPRTGHVDAIGVGATQGRGARLCGLTREIGAFFLVSYRGS